MLKNILNLEGAQQLTKKEQKGINGGSGFICSPDVFVVCRTESHCKFNPATQTWYCGY